MRTASLARSKGTRRTAPYVLSLQKRMLDIVVASLILFLIAPVMIVVALLVRMSSAGPIIFRQRRNGLGGPFEIYKFRTMFHQPEEQTSGFLKQASRGDSRVTPIGYWLRRLSLDELPQIFNVLQGKMSLVGPRPHALSHDTYFSQHVSDYMLRYSCRPGITGLAQISGSRGETGTHADMQRRIDFDLQYIASASLRQDLTTIFLTAWQQLARSKDVY